MSDPIRIFNTTLHEPSPPQHRSGLGPAQGREVSTDATFDDVQRVAGELLDAAIDSGADAVMVGGLSSVAVAVYLSATDRGLAVLEAVTERIRDERDRFVFRHRGFRVLAEPSAEVCPRERWKRWRERFAVSGDLPED